MTCFTKLWQRPTSVGKALKVQDSTHSRRVGFVAKNLKELKKKVSTKFQLSEKKVSLVLEEDGTEIDDEYFATLLDHTVLVVMEDGDNFVPRKLMLERALSTLLDCSQWHRLGDEINARLKSEMAAPHLYILGHLAAGMKMNLTGETRDEDPDWFQDVAARFKTKDSYMREKARSRVRGFYYHAKDYITNTKAVNTKQRTHLQQTLESFSQELKRQDYFGDYFARVSGSDKLRYCDQDGWFRCLGRYNEDSCHCTDHLINPYGGRETRVLFSSWELDHVVEKSREALPNLVRAVQSIPSSHRIHWEYFFKLLFTKDNLKLVHPVCHDKSGHSSAICDPKSIFVKEK